MIVIDKNTLDRLEAVAHRPRCPYSLETMLTTIANTRTDPVLFADLIEMQVIAIDVALTFAERRKAAGDGKNFLRIMTCVAETFGYALSRLSGVQPSPSKDVAHAVYETCTEGFAFALGNNIAWVDPPAPPKRPNAPTSSVLN
jgi:hypothetical protein